MKVIHRMLSIYDYDDMADLKLIAFAAKNIARKATVPSPGSFALSTGRFRTFSHFLQNRCPATAMDSVASASCKQHLSGTHLWSQQLRYRDLEWKRNSKCLVADTYQRRRI